MADPVDVDAEADVLPRDVPGPRSAGTQHDRCRIGGLGSDFNDPGAQIGTRAERGEHVEIVVGHHGGGD